MTSIVAGQSLLSLVAALLHADSGPRCAGLNVPPAFRSRAVIRCRGLLLLAKLKEMVMVSDAVLVAPA